MNKRILAISLLALSFAVAASLKIRREKSTDDSYDSSLESSNSQPNSSSSSNSSAAGSTNVNSTTNNTTNNTVDYAALVASLITAQTAVDRLNILDKDTDWIFDFLNPPSQAPKATGKGGHTVTANRKGFPAVVGNGMSMIIGFIGPCGLNTPHIHPRATEMNFAVNGTFATGFVAENGARQVLNTASPGTLSILPQGSIHWEANLGCDTVMFVAAFNNEDPGGSQIAQNFFRVDEGILSATLGGVSADFINGTASIIPDSIALGLQSCLKKCGIAESTSSGNQSQSDSQSSSSNSSDNDISYGY